MISNIVLYLVKKENV